MVLVFTASVAGMMLQVLLSQDVQLLLYFIHGLVSGVSHGLGLGLGLSRIVELWFCICRVLVYRWDDVRRCIVPGCMVMVVLYSWSGVRDIPWSRVRVRVPADCRVMVLVFTGT